MRSYYKHLEATSFQNTEKKTITRSSAIFPFFQNEHFSSRLLFLGYWQLKRKIKTLSLHFTLRDEQGVVLVKEEKKIEKVKSFAIESCSLLEKNSLPFYGSLEVEFFSEEDLFFPFPAVVLNTYGKTFSSFVHSAERIFNNFSDEQDSLAAKVPEGGFDLIATEEISPFISFINGPEKILDFQIEAIFYNFLGEKLPFSFKKASLNPYECFILEPTLLSPLKEFLKNKKGTASLTFNLPHVFPRLIVGSFFKNREALSLTHTYFDLQHQGGKEDFWNQENEDFFEASLLIPFLPAPFLSEVIFYPILSPTPFELFFQRFDLNGNLIEETPPLLFNPKETPFPLSFHKIFQPLKEATSVRVIGNKKGDFFPTRIKIGLNYAPEKGIASNICTNLQLYNATFEKKETSFKWAPIAPFPHETTLWILNSSPKKKFEKEAHLKIEIYREQDEKIYQKELTLAPNACLLLKPSDERALKEFLGDSPGWCVVKSDNPYLGFFYLSESPLLLGGDHGF